MRRRFLVHLVLALLATALIYKLSVRYFSQQQQQQFAPTTLPPAKAPQKTADGSADQKVAKKADAVVAVLRQCGYVTMHQQNEVNKICEPEQTPERPICLVMKVEHLDQSDFHQAKLILPSSSGLKIFVHPNKDMISNSILSSGGWDSGGVGRVLQALASLPGAALVDIGSNLGVFSLRAAHLGRPVVSIDANYQNVVRLRKSMLANGLDKKSEIYWNALSAEPGTLQMRLPSDCNIGGGMPMNDKQETHWLKDPIQVRTVDLDSILLSSRVLKDAKELVIKIDIEGYEWIAMTTAGKAFSQFRVAVVQMEWRGTQVFHPEKADVLLQFFSARNYSAFTLHQRPEPLNPKNEKKWPGDIMWIRSDYRSKMNI